MNDFRIPKTKRFVELIFHGGKSIGAEVFLTDAAPEHGGPERVSDLFGGRKAFVPCVDKETHRTHLVCATAVVAIVVDGEAEQDDSLQHTIPTEYDVQVHLLDGQKIRGLIVYTRPEETSRLSDFLNCVHGPFLPLIQDDKVCLVNRRFVTHLVPMDEEG